MFVPVGKALRKRSKHTREWQRCIISSNRRDGRMRVDGAEFQLHAAPLAPRCDHPTIVMGSVGRETSATALLQVYYYYDLVRGRVGEKTQPFSRCMCIASTSGNVSH